MLVKIASVYFKGQGVSEVSYNPYKPEKWPLLSPLSAHSLHDPPSHWFRFVQEVGLAFGAAREVRGLLAKHGGAAGVIYSTVPFLEGPISCQIRQL